jgi:hypothetical protein
MPGKYWMYLKCIHYNKILDGMWYDELKRKIDLLEKNKIKINLSELNNYLYLRYQYEQCMINEFDDKKYNLENYMQIIQYNLINHNLINHNLINHNLINHNLIKNDTGYDADTDTEAKYIDPKFNAMMNILSDKLAAFTMAY